MLVSIALEVLPDQSLSILQLVNSAQRVGIVRLVLKHLPRVVQDNMLPSQVQSPVRIAMTVYQDSIAQDWVLKQPSSLVQRALCVHELVNL